MITVTKSSHETKRVVTYTEEVRITLPTALIDMIIKCKSIKITCIKMLRQFDAGIGLLHAKVLIEYIQDNIQPGKYHPDLRITLSPYQEDHALTYIIHQEKTETIYPDTDHPDDFEWRGLPCE